MNKTFFAVSSVLMLSACGGGGSGSSNPPAPPTPLSISLSASSGAASTTEGATQTTLTTTATLTGTLPAASIADVQFDKTVFSSVTATAGTTGNTYTITAQTLPDLGGGDYKGNITFRLCREVACTNVHTGSATTYSYNINVKLQDWQTFQRNAAHTGYVHVTLDPSKFAKAWEWTHPESAGIGISTVTTANGNVFISHGNSTIYPGTLFAISQATGVTLWTANVPNPVAMGPPSSNNGKVYIPALRSPQDNAVYVFDAIKGTYLYKSIFYAQSDMPGPVVSFGNNFYVASGTYGGEVSSHSDLNGGINWRTMSTIGNVTGGQSPAVDDAHVYYTSGLGLLVLDRLTGAVNAAIPDLLGERNGYNYLGSPVITKNNSVIALSGSGGNGYYASRPLIRFDTAEKSVVWRTSQGYAIQPAYAKGLIYTAKNASPRFEVINENDGSLAWTWAPPLADAAFLNNVVLTKNLAFVSTNLAVYAIDLTTHQSVWSYPVGGNLAISPDFKLYIQPADSVNLGRLIAISLR